MNYLLTFRIAGIAVRLKTQDPPLALRPLSTWAGCLLRCLCMLTLLALPLLTEAHTQQEDRGSWSNPEVPPGFFQWGHKDRGRTLLP